MRFSDFVTLQRGFDLTKSDMCNGPYPVIGSTSIIGYHQEFKVEPPGVTTGRSGSLGIVQYVAERFWPHNTSLWVKDFKGNDPKFVYYCMQGVDFARFNAGAGVPTLNRNHLDTLEVQVPPLHMQQRIAGILSTYDELIENSQRRIKVLEAIARGLYREWFVHFRFPGHENHPRVASALGEIPEGWEVQKLGQVATVLRGRSYRSVDLAVEGGLPFLNLKCLDRDGGFRRSGLKRYVGEYKDSHIARKGDIVMAVTDMTQERRIVARAALVPTLASDFSIFSMDLVKIEPKADMPKTFLYSFLRFSSFADEVKQHANGANVLHLSPDRISEYQFAVPPTGVVSKFAEFASPVIEQMNALENRIGNLRHTRDLLLPRLLSGQISVDPKEVIT
jgi:type I restriction enzyme S subunit